MTDKPKYKQTEVGLIPCDWNVKSLKEIFDLFAGGDVDSSHFSPVKTDVYQYEIFSNGIENSGIYGYTDKPNYKGDSVTITGRGSVGVAMYRANDFDAIIRLLVLTPKKKNCVNSFFVAQYINSSVEFHLESTGVPQLTVPQIKDVLVPLPSLEEQKRIAQALSDVDAVISTTGKLIAKKKALKQGAMQTLLSGKMRIQNDKWIKTTHFKQTELGPIPQDWETKPMESLIKDISDGPFGSNLKTEHYTSKQEARIVQLSNVGEDGWNDENVKYTTFSHAKDLARCIVPYGAIIIAKMMPAGRSIICPGDEKMYILGSDCVKFIPNDSLNSKYFIYFSKCDFYLKQIADNTQGSTRARTSVSKLKKIQVLLPSKPEQTAIATVLSDMDSEIAALETKLAKYRQLKTGMMQQLLTGKTRLV